MPRPLLILLASLALVGCNGRSERAGGGLLATSQQAPALSGSGEWLAVVSDRGGRPTVQLRRLSDGSIVSVPQLSRHQPHSSPSLSWNGRYLAAITQRGRRRLAVVTDRLNGRMHPLPLPGEGPGAAQPGAGCPADRPAGDGSGEVARGTAGSE